MATRQRGTAELRRRVGEARQALRTVPASPADARRHLVDALRHAVDGDFSGMYHILRAESGWRLWIPPATSGLERAGRAWISRGAGTLFVPAFDPELPPPEQVGRFQSLVRENRHLRIYREFYEPFGFGQQLRSLFYDQDRFLGWVGVLRCADKPGFSAGDKNALDTLAPAIQGVLSTLDRQERASTEGFTPAHLVYSPSGALLNAEPAVLPWLTRHRRRALSGYAAAFDAGAAPDRIVLDRAEVSCVRLVGKRTVYLMTLGRVSNALRSPLAALSPRGREIAQYAAAGATGVEIARTLGIGSHTVRQHLKQIYRKLGVASRLELSAMLESFPPKR